MTITGLAVMILVAIVVALIGYIIGFELFLRWMDRDMEKRFNGREYR